MTQADGLKPSGRRRRRPPYRPVRAFLSLGISATPLPPRFRQGVSGKRVSSGRGYAVASRRRHRRWQPGFFGRIPANSYIEMMVSLLALVLLYSLVQLYGVNRDFRWFDRQDGRPRRSRPFSIFDAFFCVLSGRPKGFYATGRGYAQNGQGAFGNPFEIRHASACGADAVFPLVVSDAGFSRHRNRFVNAIRLLPGAMGKGGGNALEPVLRQLAFKFDTRISWALSRR